MAKKVGRELLLLCIILIMSISTSLTGNYLLVDRNSGKESTLEEKSLTPPEVNHLNENHGLTQEFYKSPNKITDTTIYNIAVICLTITTIDSDQDHTIAEIKTNLMNNIDNYWSQVTAGQVDIVYNLPQDPDWYYPECPVQDPCTNLIREEQVLAFINEAVRKAIVNGDFTQEALQSSDLIFIWTNNYEIDESRNFRHDQGTGITITYNSESWDSNVTIVSQKRLGIAATPAEEERLDRQIWGLGAHMIGHYLGLDHIYGDDWNSQYDLMANGCLNASGLSTYNLATMGWLDASKLEVVRPGHIDPVEVDLMPRYRDILPSNTKQSILIERRDRADNSYYFVEVIENQYEDAYLTRKGVYIYRNESSSPQLLYEISSQTQQPVTTPGGEVEILFDYDSGSSTPDFEDTNAELRIYIVQYYDSGDKAGGYLIKVENSPNSGSDTYPDLAITPWGAPDYESIDIWVDNYVNGWGLCGLDDALPCTGVGNGDYPQALKPNRLYARIHNIGEEDILGRKIEVHFWDRALTAGTTGFNYLGKNDTITELKKHESVDVYIIWEPDNIQGVTFGPDDVGRAPGGACVWVNVSKDDYEPETALLNNGGSEPREPPIDYWTQENIHYLMSPTASSSTPSPLKASVKSTSLPPDFITLLEDNNLSISELANMNELTVDAIEQLLTPRTVQLEVGNPFTETKSIYIDFIDRQYKWFVVNRSNSFIDQFHNITANSTMTFELSLIPLPFPGKIEFGVPLKAHIVVSSLETSTIDVPFSKIVEIELRIFGGVTIDGRFTYRTDFSLNSELTTDGNKILISGSLTSPDISIATIFTTSPYKARRIRLDIQNKDNDKLDMIFIDVQTDGSFYYEYTPLEEGTHVIQALYAGISKLTPAISKAIEVQIPPTTSTTEGTSSTTTTTTTLEEGTFWSTFGSIGALMLLIIFITTRKKREKK